MAFFCLIYEVDIKSNWEHGISVCQKSFYQNRKYVSTISEKVVLGDIFRGLPSVGNKEKQVHQWKFRSQMWRGRRSEASLPNSFCVCVCMYVRVYVCVCMWVCGRGVVFAVSLPSMGFYHFSTSSGWYLYHENNKKMTNFTTSNLLSKQNNVQYIG